MERRAHDEFDFEIEYGEGFEEAIADGKMPGNLARVKVGDEFIVGGEDYYTESPIMGVTLAESLEAVPAIIDGETAVIDFPDGGGTILIIEPRDKQTVSVTPAVSESAITDPSERIFDSVSVTKEVVVAELIQTAKEWRNRALDINSAIADVDWFEDLEQAIADAESRFQKFDW